jgi:D-sedoheptulose 7-phosphate isomerase
VDCCQEIEYYNGYSDIEVQISNGSHAFIAEYLSESSSAMATFSKDRHFAEVLGAMAEAIAQALDRGRKLLIIGNGGSAADAQHIAGEFVSRLMFDRAPLPAIALTTDTTVLTAIGNDYGYESVFERQVLALGQPGDVLLGISTSGKSPNVLRAFEAARSRGLVIVGFTGSQGGSFGQWCDLVLEAPSTKTAIIQQIHITAGHVVCALVESAMFPARVATAPASPPAATLA